MAIRKNNGKAYSVSIAGFEIMRELHPRELLGAIRILQEVDPLVAVECGYPALARVNKSKPELVSELFVEL